MKKFYSLALLSGLLMLGSCANDGSEPNYEPIDEEGNIGYIRFDFPNAETRAFTENSKTSKETEIENAAFVFYYGANNQNSFTRVVRKVKQPGDQAEWVTTDESHNGTKCAIVKLHRMVNAVAVVVNGEKDYSGDLNDDSYAVTKYAKGDNSLFYMSSARYYDDNKKLTNLTPITGEMLFKDEAEATSADNKDKAVIVNVEHYVAKVNVKNTFSDKYKLDDKGYVDPLANQTADKKEVNAVVKFKPVYTCLTGYATGTTTIKKLPEFGDIPTNAQNWPDLYSAQGRWSSWLRPDSKNVKWPTLTELTGDTKLLGTESKAFNSGKTFYTFDNNDPVDAKNTSVVVCGQYVVTDNDGKSLTADDGSFWLVAFADKFEVYKTEKEALLAMGGEEGDKLVPEDVVVDNAAAVNPAIPAANDLKWTNWTGWMRIYNKNIVTRCLKFNKGWGYYAKPINHYSTYNMVVRNHYYDCEITGIGGMGIGIPSDNTPIIPVDPVKPTDQNYYIHMSVNVLPWRTIDNTMNWE